MNILATRSPGENKKTFVLKNGDPLESKNGFRVFLKANKKTYVSVEFESSQGERFNLMVDKLLNKGDELILPEKNKWYV